VDLGKPMMQPSGDNDWVFVPVLGEPMEQVLHLGVNVNRGAVLVNRAICALRVVGLFLVSALDQRDLESVSELVNRCCGALVANQNCMQLVDDALRDFSLPGDAIDNELDGGLLVAEKVN
jgi:hypothetical protein